MIKADNKQDNITEEKRQVIDGKQWTKQVTLTCSRLVCNHLICQKRIQVSKWGSSTDYHAVFATFCRLWLKKAHKSGITGTSESPPSFAPLFAKSVVITRCSQCLSVWETVGLQKNNQYINLQDVLIGNIYRCKLEFQGLSCLTKKKTGDPLKSPRKQQHAKLTSKTVTFVWLRVLDSIPGQISGGIRQVLQGF